MMLELLSAFLMTSPTANAATFTCRTDSTTDQIQVQIDSAKKLGRFCVTESGALKRGEAAKLSFDMDTHKNLQFDGVTQLRRVLFSAPKYSYDGIKGSLFDAHLTYVENPTCAACDDYNTGMKLKCTKIDDSLAKRCQTPDESTELKPLKMEMFNRMVKRIVDDTWNKQEWVTFISDQGEFMIVVFQPYGIQLYTESSIYSGEESTARESIRKVLKWSIYKQTTNQAGLAKLKKFMSKK